MAVSLSFGGLAEIKLPKAGCRWFSRLGYRNGVEPDITPLPGKDK
jgi:hypothetical protein